MIAGMFLLAVGISTWAIALTSEAYMLTAVLLIVQGAAFVTLGLAGALLWSPKPAGRAAARGKYDFGV